MKPLCVEFWSVRINGVFCDGVKGIMYARPNADTILASLHVPPESKADFLRQEKWIKFSAITHNMASITDIVAWVDHAVQLPGTGKYFTLIVYRKGKEPKEDVEF